MLNIIEASPSTPTDNMEVELNIIPLDLRLNELQRKEAYRIFNKSNDDHTKLMLTNSRPPLNSNESQAYHLKKLYNNTLRFMKVNYGNATPEEIVAPLNHYE